MPRESLMTLRILLLVLAGVLHASPPAPAQTVDQPDFASRLVQAALERTHHRVVYDGSYRRLAYPGGDVPDDRGVCTDVVIRAYRAVGIDLQRRVHEDRLVALDAYPRTWGPPRLDANIDHRRVPNLQTFFRRKGMELQVTQDPDDYQPGDLVTWMLPGDLPHIGIVTDRRSGAERRPLIVHNIGRGPALEDVLFRYRISGHYRYGQNCRVARPDSLR